MAFPKKVNLLAHWKLNDNAANDVVIDSKGSHNGQFKTANTSARAVTGKINGALNFVRSNSDYITVPHHTDFNRSVFSISMWANKPLNDVFWDRFFTKKLSYPEFNGFEMTLSAQNTGRPFYIIGSNDVFSTVDPGFDWPGTGWHHVVSTWNGTVVKIYTDSIYRGQADIVSVINNTNPILFGTSPSYGELGVTSWNGYMDDIRYYDIELTQANVDALWNNGMGTESESGFPWELSGRNSHIVSNLL